jgi:hypothetical protein
MGDSRNLGGIIIISPCALLAPPAYENSRPITGSF